MADPSLHDEFFETHGWVVSPPVRLPLAADARSVFVHGRWLQDRADVVRWAKAIADRTRDLPLPPELEP